MKVLFSLVFGCFATVGAPLGMTVRVLNLAHVQARTVTAAENAASEIFRKAGVTVTWVDCDAPAACRGEPGATGFWLQLLEKQPKVLPGDVMGFALLTHQPLNDGGYAAVAWQAVRVLVDSMKLDTVPVLGAAMAHELGHLLLGSQQHSREGVMVAHMGRRQLALAARGALLFSGAQAEAIRREMEQRNAR